MLTKLMNDPARREGGGWKEKSLNRGREAMAAGFVIKYLGDAFRFSVSQQVRFSVSQRPHY